jgi:hypothetical protein
MSTLTQVKAIYSEAKGCKGPETIKAITSAYTAICRAQSAGPVVNEIYLIAPKLESYWGSLATLLRKCYGVVLYVERQYSSSFVRLIGTAEAVSFAKETLNFLLENTKLNFQRYRKTVETQSKKETLDLRQRYIKGFFKAARVTLTAQGGEVTLSEGVIKAAQEKGLEIPELTAA